MAYQSINPYDGKLQQSFEHIERGQLETALATAESCFQTWKHTSYAERAAIIDKAVALLNDVWTSSLGSKRLRWASASMKRVTR